MRISDWSSDVCSSDLIMMAVITGTFGGVLRDVLCNEIPMILQRGRIYASAVVAGATLYVVAQHLGLDRDAASYLGMGTIAGLRLAAIWWDQIGRASCRDRVCQYV